MIEASCLTIVRISSHRFNRPGSAPGGSASGSDSFSNLLKLVQQNQGISRFVGPQYRFLCFQFFTHDEEVVLIDKYLYHRCSAVEIMQYLGVFLNVYQHINLRK